MKIGGSAHAICDAIPWHSLAIISPFLLPLLPHSCTPTPPPLAFILYPGMLGTSDGIRAPNLLPALGKAARSAFHSRRSGESTNGLTPESVPLCAHTMGALRPLSSLPISLDTSAPTVPPPPVWAPNLSPLLMQRSDQPSFFAPTITTHNKWRGRHRFYPSTADHSHST